MKNTFTISCVLLSFGAVAFESSLLTAPQVFGAVDDRGQPRRTTVFGCFPGPDGVLTGGPIEVDVSEPADAAFVDFPFTTLLMNGPSGNRIDFVFVGDGFQTGQLASYATVVNERWATMKESDPYVSYLPYFNAHRVDVPSQDSGVDNDPVPRILKNTALDSGFWCDGIERLLCASVTKTSTSSMHRRRFRAEDLNASNGAGEQPHFCNDDFRIAIPLGPGNAVKIPARSLAFITRYNLDANDLSTFSVLPQARTPKLLGIISLAMDRTASAKAFAGTSSPAAN